MYTSTRPVPENYNPAQIRDVVERVKRKEKPKLVTIDEFPVFADDPLHDNHVLLDRYLRSIGRRDAWKVKPASLPAGRAVLETPQTDWPRHLRAVVARILYRWTHCVKKSKEMFGNIQMWQYDFGDKLWALKPLVVAILNGKPPLSADDYIALLDARRAIGAAGDEIEEYFPVNAIIRAGADVVARGGLRPDLHTALSRLQRQCKSSGTAREARERMERIDEIMGVVSPQRKQLLEPGEPWAEAAIALLEKSPGEAKRWEPLLRHCNDSESSKPSGKWLKEAKRLIDTVGAASFAARAGEWLALAATPRTKPLDERQVAYPWEAQFDIYSDKNEPILKGLTWACAAAEDPKLAGPLGQLAEWCYAKIRMYGPRSPKVGNGCLLSLIALPGMEPRAELSRLKAKVKQPTAKKMIEKAIGASAAAAGMTADDLEELAVAGYGLSEVGRGERKIGSYTAETRITGTTKAELKFTDVKGKSRASVPADLKGKDAEAVKELQHNAKELAKMLPALRDRLERLPMNRRELPMASWRTRYFDHPVVATLARRLIWELVPDPSKPDKTIAAMWLDGRLVDANDEKIKKLDELKTLVRLWHPSTWPPGNVLGWRNFLDRHQITQPFKQAHREVYLLTDAERATETYSNRFATHILRQHQFAALCTQRGWRYKLIGSWDGGGDNTPTLELPRWNLTAQLWVDPSGDAASDVGSTGVANFVTTDQIRFYEGAPANKRVEKPAEPKLVPLEKVPPLAFSEVMRDVDLFVGVTSMGNDPNALPADDRNHGYWQRFMFGDLNETAKTRRAVLERLIPRLELAPRASLVDKFLVIKGDLRTYKIHLGSGNILMEPNDQYLCIVPDRDAKAARDANVFLPFEGDHTLAVILSKAFLLAKDTKITDKTITRQIAMNKAVR